MDQNVRRFTGVGAVCPEELTTRRPNSATEPPHANRGRAVSGRPSGPQMPRDSRRHLRLVPDIAVAAAAPGEERTADEGLASVTHLPAYIPAEEEHDGDEGEDRGAVAPEVDQGTRPRTDGELEEQEDEEDFPRQVAAALPVPRLGGRHAVTGRATSGGKAAQRVVHAAIVSTYPLRVCGKCARA
jgi:hypothetical protein